MSNQLRIFVQHKNTRDVALATLLLSLLYFLQLVFFYGVGGRDDSYISYWSAYSLSHLGEIVNYNGDRIEQSSSLLHVLLLAILHKASGLSLPTLGILFSSVCAIATAILAARLARDTDITFYLWLPFIIISVPYFTYWSSSGMETSLVALCVILFIITLKTFLAKPFSTTHFLRVFSTITLYILVRPESSIVLFIFFIALLVLKTINTKNPGIKQDAKKIAALILVTSICFLCLAAWRYFYFGQYFPQPVYAKTDVMHTLERARLGLLYLQYSLNFSTTLLLVLAIVGITRLFLHREKNIHCSIKHSLLFLLTYLAFVVFAGGDWMEGRRLLVPVIPLLCLLALAGIYNKKTVLLFLVLFFCVATIDGWRFSRQESIGLTPAQAAYYSSIIGEKNISDARFSAMDKFNYSHMRDMLTIPALDELVTSLANKQDGPVYIASRQMGMIPYYIAIKHYKRVRFVDLRGLVTKDIPDCHFIADNKPKSASGILITSRFYLENQTQINTECSLPLVDIIYDTGFINNSVEETATVLAANGYALHYSQGSKIENLFAQYIGLRNKNLGH